YAVRFELAEAYFKEAALLKNSKDAKDKAIAPKIFALAQERYEKLADTDSDFAEKANQANLFLSLQRIGEKGKIDELKDFDECYLKAQYELIKVKEVNAKLGGTDKVEEKKLEAERTQHLK